ncbi:MAG: 4-hydroxythreonine-4-phosphate dehydrogenase PdxA [Silicimonas sp.]|nr:4-hydroxythreonine-4-phosphate dehydrogenase PdxA [Silicimonas sp.]
MTDLPPVAVSCGDPSGIGLEVALGAWRVLKDEIPFFVIGDPGHMPQEAPVAIIETPGKAARVAKDGLPILPHAFRSPARPGYPAPENALGVVEAIQRAVDLVQKGAASAICTAPISKKQLADHAGFRFPGHTEFLADLAGIDHPVMMLTGRDLRVVPATIHIPLAEVPDALTPDLLETTIRITEAALHQNFGISKPRIAVAGLNPHAGEGGMLGQEDASVITPVCDRLRAEGMAITGPLPADTMFHDQARTGYDVAIAMYHDQALIPVKTLAFDTGVNVTLGLPFVRTSPDHGTAFDIAGQGIANPASMIEALRLAWRMAHAQTALGTA